MRYCILGEGILSFYVWGKFVFFLNIFFFWVLSLFWKKLWVEIDFNSIIKIKYIILLRVMLYV